MQSAKDSVKKVLSKSGQHDTTVHENVAPAVQHETVSPTQHDRVTTAIDREVHQHHYHTTEQPVHHQETLQEQHHHKEMPMESRTFEHGDQAAVDRRLADERAQYQHSSTRVDGEHTRSTEPSVAGEHVHHHVHENIQPVVHKQTVEPHVVHSTVPIHEVHHNEAQHHGTHSLPAVSMDDFKNQGGSLKGREERSDFFPGEPRGFGGEGTSGTTGASRDMGSNTMGSTGQTGTTGMTSGMDRDIGRDGRDAYDSRGGTTGTTGATGTSSTLGRDGRDAYDTRSGTTGTTGTSSTLGRDGQDTLENRGGTTGTTGSSGKFGTMEDSSSSAQKPSLMDKLNPKVDSSGDGKAGFMK